MRHLLPPGAATAAIASSPCRIRASRLQQLRVSFPPARMEKLQHVAAAATPPPPHHRLQALSRENETLPERLAVVTDGNRGIGREVCRQLAAQGVTVIFTATEEEREKDAVKKLRHGPNLSNIIFHELDILEDDSIAALAQYIESRYGKLDILVYNTGLAGFQVPGKAVHRLEGVFPHAWRARACQQVTEALLPLLKQSTSGARIVITTSLWSERTPEEKFQDELRDVDAWDEDRINEILDEYLEDLKKQRLEEAGWPAMRLVYNIPSTKVLQLYTRFLAKKHPEMRVNWVGFVKTKINGNTGVILPAECARGAVKLALLPNDGPTGCYFNHTKLV